MFKFNKNGAKIEEVESKSAEQESKCIGVEQKKKWSKKKIALVYILILVATSAGSYFYTSYTLDKDIAKKLAEIDKTVADSDSKTESSSNPNSTGITASDVSNKKSLSVDVDTLPQELVEPKEGLPFQNKDGWYLVDTDGDMKGDAYWGISKEDAQGEKYGKLYLFSTETRKTKKVKVQDANPTKGIEEKWEEQPDWSYTINPQFLIPAQFCKEGVGTILDWKQLN